MTATVVSRRVSMPEKLAINGMDVSTAILKEPGEGRAYVDLDSPSGTETAMRPEAVYAFFAGQYDFWASLLGVAMSLSQSRHWGEHLTLRGLDEQSMRIWPSRSPLIGVSLSRPLTAVVHAGERLVLVRLHRWHLRVPHYLETTRWSTQLQRTGKIQHIGGNSFDIAHMREQVEACVLPISVQVQCCALARWPETFSRNAGSAHQHPPKGSKPIPSDQQRSWRLRSGRRAWFARRVDPRHCQGSSDSRARARLRFAPSCGYTVTAHTGTHWWIDGCCQIVVSSERPEHARSLHY
jgi:hypothetical protein